MAYDSVKSKTKYLEMKESESPEERKERLAKASAYGKVWHAKKKNDPEYLEKRRAYAREYNKKNWKKYNKVRKQRQKEDINYTFKYCLSNSKSRAKKAGMAHEIDIDYLKELWDKQQGLCALTKLPMTHAETTKNHKGINTRLSIDRISSRKGYTKGNVQLTLTSVNIMKNNLGQKSFFKLCKEIAEHNKVYVYD